ncbi:hypothetical protein [Kribbella deserti]|uniref:Uncharacterized protein n=1 Tax=Kribbella deserti TaxID=1926257 RepID=A0ABV6QNP8_9ACTN
MNKVHCWRLRIQQHNYLFLVFTSSVSSAKHLARQHGVSGPKESELIKAKAIVPYLAGIELEPDVLYVADEEADAIRFEPVTNRPG